MEGRCAGCCNWLQRKGKAAPEPGWGECERAQQYQGKPFFPETLAYAADWPFGEQAHLRTHETFGCVLFAQKALT